MLQTRIEGLKKFPIKSQVTWKFDDEILTVVGYDEKLGRVKTNNGMSYDPGELEKYPKE
jgi:hypothetical protein